jgi:small subunit ribosomal protein S35
MKCQTSRVRVVFRTFDIYIAKLRSAYQQPFVPPTPATPLIVRSIHYGGEEHPATVKRTIVVPVSHLPLQGDDAIHKIKLLAGPRWTPTPPSDSGVGPDEPGMEHGYIKIACEDFPQPAMNLKWASDALDRLIVEANVNVIFWCEKPLTDSFFFRAEFEK